MAHLQDNLGAVGWQLSAKQQVRLTAVSEVSPPYPYDFIAKAVGER